MHVDKCGVVGKRRTSDRNVTSSRPPLATKHIRCVLLVNSPKKLNLLSWLLIYLCNKIKCIAPSFKKKYAHLAGHAVDYFGKLHNEALHIGVLRGGGQKIG